MHDWFTQTGQGYGTEYRWMRSATSLGNLRAYQLAQKAATVERRSRCPNRAASCVNGSISQDLPLRLKGRARIDYSSNLTLNQLYSQDVFNATQSQSTWNGNVSGSWRFLNASATAQRSAAVLQRDLVADQRIAAQHHRRGVEPQAGAAAGLLRAAVRGGAPDLHPDATATPRSTRSLDRVPTPPRRCGCRSTG